MRPRLRISEASAEERAAVYELRHETYAVELGQYAAQPGQTLPDADEVESVYLVAILGAELVGFVGVTPPHSPRFSVENHLAGHPEKFVRDAQMFEIRALTVRSARRGSLIVAALLYAAFRWVQAHGGSQIVSIGRREVLGMYLRLGMKRMGASLACGEVNYDLIRGDVAAMSLQLQRVEARLQRLQDQIDWDLPMAFPRPAACYHGGAFFDTIGVQFDAMQRIDEVINADVLDAWFPPAPAAEAALRDHLPWLMRTSPPTRAEGLEAVIAEVRGVDPSCVLAGGGSSDLIFLAFNQWLDAGSKVLLLDPTYGEYTHVLEQLIHCKVTSFPLHRSNDYEVDLDELVEQLAGDYDLFIWVNPNSPTGKHVSRPAVEKVLHQVDANTRVWIDETYVEYAGADQSLESFAVNNRNVLVCKSMSKVYALSGLRVAYLCANPHQLEALRQVTPPWAVSLPAQVAATHALREDQYYQARYQQTHELRRELIVGLAVLGLADVVHGVANFVLVQLPPGGRTAAQLVKVCRQRQLFIRDASGMGCTLGPYAVRIAVKDQKTNLRMLAILAEVLAE